MAGDTGLSTEAAPVVAAGAEHNEGPLLQELIGYQEMLREEEIGDDSGSELS
jgi:hypothetical protein